MVGSHPKSRLAALSQNLVIASEAKQSPCKGKIASSPAASRNDES